MQCWMLLLLTEYKSLATWLGVFLSTLPRALCPHSPSLVLGAPPLRLRLRETSKDGADGSNFEWADGYNTRFGVTYLDYKDEQRRYPKASANFIKSWFDAHISKPNPGSSDVDEIEVEDTTSEISTDGQSPITRVE